MVTRNERSLLSEFTRIQRAEDGWNFEYCEITSPDPAASEIVWRTVAKVASPADANQVHRARIALIERPDLFPICVRCGKRTSTSWINEEGVCHTCTAGDAVAV